MTKQSMAEYARDQIFHPLGMKSTVVRDAHRKLIPNLAACYAAWRPQLKRHLGLFAGASRMIRRARRPFERRGSGCGTRIFRCGRWR